MVFGDGAALESERRRGVVVRAAAEAVAASASVGAIAAEGVVVADGGPEDGCGAPTPEAAARPEPRAPAGPGITDDDVADRPPFRAITRRLARLQDGCDLAGFGIRRFDLPFLRAEFERARMEFRLRPAQSE